MSNLRVRIKTYGCRMNVCDSEIITSILLNGGYDNIDEYKGELTDVLILNCCSVREDGHLTALCQIHDALKINTELKIILCGCYSTLLTKSLFANIPCVNAIVRPQSYSKLPETIRRICAGEKHFIVNTTDNNDLYEDVAPRILKSLPNRAVVVAKGCNQNCTYCIEPYTRGRERYISPKTILRNIDNILARNGNSEVTLVGHLIDRYHYDDVDFPKLLAMAAEKCKEANVQIKYISSHPSTFCESILDTVLTHDNILHVVHLPVQSGSDNVLKRMHRGYSVSEFERKVDFIRKKCPDMKIVTDIMVGFCGETNRDFEDSVRLIEKICPSDINVYKFSMRQQTFAYDNYVDDVKEADKQHRYEIMNQLKRDLL